MKHSLAQAVRCVYKVFEGNYLSLYIIVESFPKASDMYDGSQVIMSATHSVCSEERLGCRVNNVEKSSHLLPNGIDASPW